MSSSTVTPPMMIPLEHSGLATRYPDLQNYLHPLLPVTNLWCQSVDQSGRADDRGPWLTNAGGEPEIEGTTRGDLLVFGRVFQDGELVKQIDPIPGHEAEGRGRGFERWTLENLRYEGEFLNGIPTGEFQLFQRAQNDKEWYMHHPVYRGRFDWFVIDDQPHFRLTGQMYWMQYHLAQPCLLLRSSGTFDTSTGEFTGTIYGMQHDHWTKLMTGKYNPESATGEGEIFRDGRLAIDGGFCISRSPIAMPHGHASRFNHYYGTLSARGTFHHGILEEGEKYVMPPGSDQVYLREKGMFMDDEVSCGERFFPSGRPELRKKLTDEHFEVVTYFDAEGSPVSKAERREKPVSDRMVPGKLIESRRFNQQKRLIEHVYHKDEKVHTDTFFDDGRPKSQKKAWTENGGWAHDYEELHPNGRPARREVVRRERNGPYGYQTSQTTVYSERDGSVLAEFATGGCTFRGPMVVNSLDGKPIAQLNFVNGKFSDEQLLFRDGQLTHRLMVDHVSQKTTGQMFYRFGELRFEGEFHPLTKVSAPTDPTLFERDFNRWSQTIKPKKGTMHSETGDREIEFDDSDTFSMLSKVESMLTEVGQREAEDDYAHPSEGLKRARC